MNAIDRMNAENPWEITVISIRNKKKIPYSWNSKDFKYNSKKS